MSWLALALHYAPPLIKDAGWVARFMKWREEKAAKGELDSQKKEVK